MLKQTIFVAGIAAALLAAPTAGAGDVTYAKQISRLIADHCQECHRPQGIGPFALMDYNDVKGWSKMIKEVVTQKRMPPWFAEKSHREFANDISLTDAERTMLIEWIDSGMARGNKADMPKPRVYETAWRMGQPDKIFEQPVEFSVPSDGLVDYQYWVTDPGFKEDVWLSGLECLPGNPKVVHHIIIYAIPPGKSIWDMDEVFESFDDAASAKPTTRREFQDWGSLYVAGYAPGIPPVELEKGVARRIPAGTTFLWELHYTPTGKVETDKSLFGIKFSKEKVNKEYITVTPGNSDFMIPAGAPKHRVVANTQLPEDAYIHAFTPHMHYRGASFVYNITYPDGRKETPLNVPNYDFNWQMTYHLKEPMLVPKGTKIECIAHFDNSAGNPYNPDPTANVRFGEQSDEEMMIGFMDITWVNDKEETSNTSAGR